MTRDLEHLQLPTWEHALPRRKRRGGHQPERDAGTHGRGLIAEAEQEVNRLEGRKQEYPQGINPKFVFKLLLDPRGDLDEQALGQMGLRLLARDPKKAIVVFPDDAALGEFRRRLEEYAGIGPKGQKYGNLAAIEAIGELEPNDRIGRRLRIQPLAPDEISLFDVELWYAGPEQARQQIRELEDFVAPRGLKVTDRWIGRYLCLMRAQLDFPTLQEMLSIDYVKEIERRPQPAFEILPILRARAQDYEPPGEIPTDLAGVLIIDSGVMQGHPLLGPAIGDAQVFPDSLRERIKGGAEDGDERTGGHGTAVAGIAIYNDVGECIGKKSFIPSALLFSARVTDDKNEYDEDELLEHQLIDAISYFLDHYAFVKVISISLGNENAVYSEDSYQFRFAATIDEIAYDYRDRNIVFIVSTGNYWPNHLTDEQLFDQYPKYLLSSSEARVIDPATSALAITVGGLCYGFGRDPSREQERDIDRPVAQERDHPSPFTRVGWGVDGAIKPDVVDYAGDFLFRRGRINEHNPGYAGLPTTNKGFAPPEGRLFRTVGGTSFAAPRVANLAAQLFREFPTASSNLIRALIAHSAKIPEMRPDPFKDKNWADEDILRVYGYGQPDFARARWSAQNDVLLLEESSLGVDRFQIYTIPGLPEEFVSSKGVRSIAVTLAFDPPTRHTRGDSYLGVTMQFALYRNTSAEAVRDVIKLWSADQLATLEEHKAPTRASLRQPGSPPVVVDLKPGAQIRNRGTLQHALIQTKNARWVYDGGPLILAVLCQRKWAPPEITEQRFAVVVSVFHEKDTVDLYTHLRQRATVYQRVRIKV